MMNYNNVATTSMMGSRGAVIENMAILEIIFRETGTYDDQFNRSYRGHMSPHELNSVMSYMEQQNTHQFRPEMLGKLAPNLISLDQAPDSGRIVNIANGWQTKRFMFMIRAMSTDLAGVITYYLVQGYTDEMGISQYSKSIDPRMSMYINNVMEMTAGASVPTNQGIVPSIRRYNSSDLLQNVAGTSDPMFKMRPTDVYSRLTSAGIAGETSAALYDSRNTLAGRPEFSRHNNNLASHFASNLIGSYMQTPVDTLGGGNMVSQTSLYENATQNLMEDAVAANPFITALSHKKNTSSMGFFRYGDLLDLDVSLANNTDRITVNFSGGGARRAAYSHSNAADWGASMVENRYAATLAQALPSLMMQTMISHVVLRTTNRHVQAYSNQQMGDFTTMITDIQSFMPGQTVELHQVENFIKRFEQEVLAPLAGGQDEIELIINSMVTGDTSIEMSINGGPFVPFVSPTFVSSLTSPVITPDFERVNNLSHQVGSFVTEIKDNLTSNDFSILTSPSSKPVKDGFF